MTLLILYIGLAIGVSFICSVLEAVLLSVTPAYVGSLQAERPALSAQLRELKDDIDRPLAAILSLNTIAHTAGAAGAGAQAAAVFGSKAVGVFSAVLTLAILVLSEIIPKTLGASYWRQLAPLTARVLRLLIAVLAPLVWLSKWITTRIASGTKHAVSRDELLAMADLGARHGVVDDSEAQILKNLLRFKSLCAGDVMTPRTVLVSFPSSSAVSEVVAANVPFSRLPIYESNRDDMVGYVLKDDVLAKAAEGAVETPLSELRRDLAVVSEKLPLPRVFDLLLERREHIALVIDEYGGTTGVVTIEDVIETLLGLEILDEVDHTKDMQRLARQRWQQRAEKLGIVPKPSLSEPDTGTAVERPPGGDATRE